MPLLFLYGTLKRGGNRHSALAGQRFLGRGRTVPGFRLFQVEDYPVMVPSDEDRLGVAGELWEVDAACLDRLDRIEGVPEKLFSRKAVKLMPPFDGANAEAYHYARSIEGCPMLGNEWRA